LRSRSVSAPTRACCGLLGEARALERQRRLVDERLEQAKRLGGLERSASGRLDADDAQHLALTEQGQVRRGRAR